MSPSKRADPARAALLLWAAALLFGAARPASGQGTNGAQILMLDMGARPASMGGAYTALSDDSNAMFYNPAGLLRLDRPEATLMQNTWIDNFRLYYAGGARRLGDDWAAGMALANVDYGKFEVVDRRGRTLDASYAAGDWIGTVSAARSLVFERVSAGGTLKFIRQDIENESAQSFAFDLGLLARARRFSGGLVLQNMGPGVRFREEADPLPFAVRAGLAARAYKGLTLALDLVKTRDTTPCVRLGGEWSLGRALGPAIALRAGYSSASGPAGGVNAGLGLAFERWELAYSLNPYGVLNTGHWFGLTIRGRLIDKPSIESRHIGKSWKQRVKEVPPMPKAQTAVETASQRSERMYRDILRWHRREADAGRLSRSQSLAVLRRIISRYALLGIDIREAQAELARVQGGGPAVPELFPDEFKDQLTPVTEPEDVLPPEEKAPVKPTTGRELSEDEALQREIDQMMRQEIQP